MAPILGIFASSQQGAGAATSFESIATVSVGSTAQSSFEFTQIPTDYQHLQLRYIARNATAAYFVRIRFNNNTTTTDYAYHVLNGGGANVTVGYENDGMYAPRQNTTSNYFAGGIVDILDYRNTNKFTTIRGLGGFDNNGVGASPGDVDFLSGVWLKTDAVTSIQISVVAGAYQQYSHFALYGIKGVA